MKRPARLVVTAVFGLFACVALSGCAAMRPGCGMGVGCGVTDCGCEAPCEPACGCEPGCAAEPDCGCEPACGCPTPCVGGRSMAGQKWIGKCGVQRPFFNVCTGPSCDPGCEPACGCAEPACGCEPDCGVEPGCGCGAVGGCSGCGCRVGENIAFGLRSIGAEFGRLLRPLGLHCGAGCGGCDGEVYWNEWHNDPPRCCDPCDDCGNWVGPSAANMRAPYEHRFAPRRVASEPDATTRLR
ncbi:MAG: hypothetical protein AAF805_11485 [Planctomycetota bacterium]